MRVRAFLASSSSVEREATEYPVHWKFFFTLRSCVNFAKISRLRGLLLDGGEFWGFNNIYGGKSNICTSLGGLRVFERVVNMVYAI